MNREQFIDVLFDLEIQELILRQDHNTFNGAVERVLYIDAINKGSRVTPSRRLAIITYLQKSDQCVEGHQVKAVSREMEPDMINVEMNEMKKQVKNQVDKIKEDPYNENRHYGQKLSTVIENSPGAQSKESAATIAPRWVTTHGNTMNQNITI